MASGVFRDLVATGRSRLSLFLVRAPAAIIVTLAFTGAAFLITVGATSCSRARPPLREPL